MPDTNASYHEFVLYWTCKDSMGIKRYFVLGYMKCMYLNIGKIKKPFVLFQLSKGIQVSFVLK
jgi:hypothetical protein